MGKQGNMKFVGTVDNLIYYKWKDIYAVRTKPVKVKQTKASKQQSRLFGMAAHTGAVLRNLLKPALPDAKDRAMMRRLEQAMVQWLRSGAYSTNEPQDNLSFITGFEFNEQSVLTSRLKLPVTVTRTQQSTVAVLIPQLQPVKDIAAPAGTKKVAVKLRAAACSLANDNNINCTGMELNIDYNDALLPAQQVELPVSLEAGNITIVMITLEYTVVKNGIERVIKDKQ